MFIISKCTGDLDLGLCTTSGLALEEPKRNGRFRKKKHVSTQEKSDFAMTLGSKVQKLCTDIDLSLLYILILGTYSKFARKNNFLALGVCFPALLERWPQVCRVKITFTKLLTNRFVSTTKKSMKCVLNWIPLRIRVRSRNTQPHLKLILGNR